MGNLVHPNKQYPPGAAPTYPGGPAVTPYPSYPQAANTGYPNASFGGYPNPGFPAGGPGGYPGNQYGPQPPVMGFHMPMQPEILVEQPKHDNVPQGVADGMDFSEKTIRRGFIRKVYSILMVQLLVSVGFIVLFLYHDGVKQWSRSNRWLYIVAMIGFFVMVLVLSCCPTVRRKSPGNFICLGLFTLMASLMLGSVTTYYREDSVLLAVGITSVVCFALTIFSFQTKIDFTRLNGFLFVCLIVLIVFGFVAVLFSHIPIIRIVYASLGALLFSVFLIHDTQLMMGGDHKYSISPEEYIFAALVKFNENSDNTVKSSRSGTRETGRIPIQLKLP